MKDIKKLIPRKIKVGALPYSVEFVAGLLDKKNQEILGTAKLDRKVIQLNPDIQSEENLVATLMHELVHTWLCAVRMQDEDEKETDRLADAILDTMIHTPKLCRLFLALSGKK